MITPARVIQKKRDGEILTHQEIHGFVNGICTGEVEDYQASALLMAIFFNGLNLNETISLTEAMVESGIKHNLSEIPGSKVDKHSTGGVGDKVSLILAPLAASCGLRVPMMSGRGLGHSGGTLDKLESIDGFNVYLNENEFKSILSKTGCVMIGQSEKIAPADKKLYSLRDVTATVECIPLIVASILSKKIAEGAEGLVLDIKVGNGAFMKNKQSAKKLAQTIMKVGNKMGLSCRALLSDMSQPLGYSVGNSLEVLESIEVLTGEKLTSSRHSSSDLKELTIQLCANMLVIGKVSRNLTEARKMAQKNLNNKSAWKTFQDLVKSQGGSLDQITNPREKLPISSNQITWDVTKDGYLSSLNTEKIGQILVELGGGRKKVSDSIDPSVGLRFHKKLGSKVTKGEPLVTLFINNDKNIQKLEKEFSESLKISRTRPNTPKLIVDSYLF